MRCSLSPYGLTVKLPLAQDWRRHTPVPRETKRWRRLYRRRTAVERSSAASRDTWPWMPSMCVAWQWPGQGAGAHLTLSLVVMLGAAWGMAQQQPWPHLRRLAA